MRASSKQASAKCDCQFIHRQLQRILAVGQLVSMAVAGMFIGVTALGQVNRAGSAHAKDLRYLMARGMVALQLVCFNAVSPMIVLMMIAAAAGGSTQRLLVQTSGAAVASGVAVACNLCHLLSEFFVHLLQGDLGVNFLVPAIATVVLTVASAGQLALCLMGIHLVAGRKPKPPARDDARANDRIDASANDRIDARANDRIDASANDRIDASANDRIDASANDIIDASANDRIDAEACERTGQTEAAPTAAP